MRRSFAVMSFAGVLLCGAMALAQGQPASQPAAAAGQAPAAGANQELKNIQVLTNLSHDDVLSSMQFMSQSLGVECDFCHVRKDNRLQPDLDDKKEKKTARDMLKMTKAINDQNFDGRQQVTCASCHNGRNQPRPFPPIADLETLQARIAAQEAARQRQQQQAQAQAQGQPPAQGQQQAQGQPPGPGGPGGGRMNMPAPMDLLKKYEAAIGGADALSKLTSRTDKFTATNPVTGVVTHGEIARKAPDKVLSTTAGERGSQTTGFDGTAAWAKSPRGVQPITGGNLDQMKFVANFWRDLRPSERYQQARPGGRTKINGHDVYIVRGVVKDTRTQEQLFFDVESGLLLRRITYRPTPMGPLADQIDFDDYRDVDGIKVPFVLKAATSEGMLVRTYTEVKFNAAVADTQFTMPAEAKTGQ